MVSATNLGKRFGHRWVFRRVEFCLAKGECLLVTGPNGSGKSTLLRLLAGLETPTQGTIQLAPTDARTAVGYSGPELSLYPHLTASEHLSLAASLRGIETRTDELLAFVGLHEIGGRLVGAYSTGMKMRLRLALAVQANPPILLLDEPSAGLDPAGKDLVSKIVSDQVEKGCVVIATNDPSDRRFGDFELTLG